MANDLGRLKGKDESIDREQNVTAMFDPLADATLDAVPLANNGHVLDLACGMGVVARKVVSLIGPAGRIAGVDVNSDMVKSARGLSEDEGGGCAWYVADAAALPFNAASFAMVFCQQGFQFFPDRLAVLREVKRVLHPGGRIAITVWAAVDALCEALTNAARQHVGDEHAERALSPFALSDWGRLVTEMWKVGYVGISVQMLTVHRRLDSVVAIEREIMSNPIGSGIAEYGDGVMAQIVSDVTTAMKPFRQGDGFDVSSQTWLIKAIV